MRKTITYKTIKSLCLVFVVCFLTATQSIAQSERDHYIPRSEAQYDAPERFDIQSIFDWFRAIVTTDMSVFMPEKSNKTVPTTSDARIKGDRANIVTTDMSIRDGGED